MSKSNNSGFVRRVRSGLWAMLQIWLDELNMIIRDKGTATILLVAPFLYPLIYAAIYQQEEVTDVPLVVVDHCRTADSRHLCRMIDATKEVRVAGFCANMAEAEACLARKDAYGILEVPSGFSHNIVRCQQTPLRLYSDMSTLVIYKALVLGCQMASLSLNAEIQTQLSAGKTAREQELNSAPLKYRHTTLFNTQNGYGSYLVPGVLILVVQQLLCLGVGMVAGTHRDLNGGGRLLPPYSYCCGTLRNVLGKALAYFVVWFPITIFVLLVVPRLFGLPQLLRPLQALPLLAPLVVSCIFYSMSLTSLIRERESVFVALVFTSIIFLFLSGMSWPWLLMPEGWRVVAQLFPSTLGIQAFLAMNTMGASAGDVSHQLVGLWILADVFFVITCFLYHFEVKKSFPNSRV